MPPITSQRIDAYNQLNQFMQFANASGRSGDDIVHLDAPSGKLSVDGNDRIKRAGNLWSAPHRDVAANNSTRATFKDLLLKLYDKQSLDELPKSVRDALRSGDFDGTGKPLSARRISAVMSAVVRTADYSDTAEAAALANFTAQAFALDKNDVNAEGGLERLQVKLEDFAEDLVKSDGPLTAVVEKMAEGVGGASTTGVLNVTASFLADLVAADARDSGAIDALRANFRREVAQAFGEENPFLPFADRERFLTDLFAELDKIAERITLRKTALAQAADSAGQPNATAIAACEKPVLKRMEFEGLCGGNVQLLADLRAEGLTEPESLRIAFSLAKTLKAGKPLVFDGQKPPAEALKELADSAVEKIGDAYRAVDTTKLGPEEKMQILNALVCLFLQAKDGAITAAVKVASAANTMAALSILEERRTQAFNTQTDREFELDGLLKNDPEKRGRHTQDAEKAYDRAMVEVFLVQARFDFIASLNCANEKIVQRMEA